MFRQLEPFLALLRKCCREDAVLWRVRLPEGTRGDIDAFEPFSPFFNLNVLGLVKGSCSLSAPLFRL
jgi:hypothetical protein